MLKLHDAAASQKPVVLTTITATTRPVLAAFSARRGVARCRALPLMLHHHALALVTSLSRAFAASERFRFLPELAGVAGGGGIGLLPASAALVLAMSAKAFKFSISASTGVSRKCQ